MDSSSRLHPAAQILLWLYGPVVLSLSSGLTWFLMGVGAKWWCLGLIIAGWVATGVIALIHFVTRG